MQPFVQAAFLLYVPVPVDGGPAAVAAAFTPAVKAALLAGIAHALGIDVSGVFISSITPYTYRRRRSLYLQPSAGTGVTVSTGILASAAASSPLVMAAIGGGAADASAVMAATVTVVQSQMASGALAAAVAAQPAIVSGLGYSSPTQLIAQLTLDGTPVERAPPPPAGPSSPGGGASGGAVGAVVAALLLAVCGLAGYRFVFMPWRARTGALEEYRRQHLHPHPHAHLRRSQLPKAPNSAAVAPRAAPERADSDDPAAAAVELLTPAEAQAQVHEKGKALANAEAQLRAQADEVERTRMQLEAQERAQAQAHSQVLAQAQGLALAVAAQSAVSSAHPASWGQAASAPPAPWGQFATAPPAPLGQVPDGSAAAVAALFAGSFAGPSAEQLRSGLSDLDFVLDADVSAFLDAHGLVDVLGGKTSRAPLRVTSLAEVCTADGRRFLPLATRRLALLGFVVSREAGGSGRGGDGSGEGSGAHGGRDGDVPSKD